MDKLDSIIQEKQAELQALQEDLTDALTGIDSPDYSRAARIQPLIWDVRREIERVENLRQVRPAPQDFSSHLSRLLTDDTMISMELWTEIRYHEVEMTIRLLEIRKLKNSHILGCKLHFTGPRERYWNSDHTTLKLQGIGWTAGRGGKIFWLKGRVKNPHEFDAFCQRMAVTMIEALSGHWGRGKQYYRFR